jgi:Putative peptidoglycan binding domain
MRWSSLLGILGAMSIAYGFEPSTTTITKKATKPAATAKSAKTPTSASKSKRTRSKGRVTRKAARASYQAHPDPERYAEIQKALADRGYFHGAANGEWKDDSVDALKRFQADQKLPDDGKISALTLTGLGLGPHHDGSTAATVPLPTAAVSEPPVSGSTVGPASSTLPKRDQP